MTEKTWYCAIFWSNGIKKDIVVRESESCIWFLSGRREFKKGTTHEWVQSFDDAKNLLADNVKSGIQNHENQILRLRERLEKINSLSETEK